jgi:hypothetical protein
MYQIFSSFTILHSPFSIRNSQFHARRMRRRAPVVSGARNAQRSLGLRRVRRLFAHFKKAALFSKIKTVGRRLPSERRLPACNERDSVNIFAGTRTLVRAKDAS